MRRHIRNEHPGAGKNDMAYGGHDVRTHLAYADTMPLVSNPDRTNTTSAEDIAGQKYVPSIFFAYALTNAHAAHSKTGS